MLGFTAEIRVVGDSGKITLLIQFILLGKSVPSIKWIRQCKYTYRELLCRVNLEFFLCALFYDKLYMHFLSAHFSDIKLFY